MGVLKIIAIQVLPVINYMYYYSSTTCVCISEMELLPQYVLLLMINERTEELRLQHFLCEYIFLKCTHTLELHSNTD